MCFCEKQCSDPEMFCHCRAPKRDLCAALQTARAGGRLRGARFSLGPLGAGSRERRRADQSPRGSQTPGPIAEEPGRTGTATPAATPAASGPALSAGCGLRGRGLSRCLEPTGSGPADPPADPRTGCRPRREQPPVFPGAESAGPPRSGAGAAQ